MNRSIALKKLSAQNFGRHEEFEIEFASTLTVIKGPNGSGKSTVLQMIFFAAFGVSAVDGAAKSIPRNGQKDCLVTLWLMVGDATFAITRTLGNANVHDESGILVASGHTAVNAWVEDQLGVSQKVFLALTYSEQTETAAIMTIGAAALNRMVEEIAEVDFVAEVEKKSAQFSTTASAKLSVIEKPKDTGELHVQLTEAKVDDTACATRLALAETAMLTTDEVHKETTAELAIVKAKDAKLKALEAGAVQERAAQTRHKLAMDSALAQLSDIKTTQADLDVATEQRDQLSASVREKTEVFNDHAVRVKRVGQLNKWLETGSQNLATYRELKPQLDAALVLHETSVAEANAAAQIEVDATNALITARKAVENAACPTCQRAFDADTAADAKRTEQLVSEAFNNARTRTVETATAARAALRQYKEIQGRMPSGSIEAEHAEKLAELKELQLTECPVTAEMLEAENDKLAEAMSAIKSAKRDLTRKEDLTTEYNTAETRYTTVTDQLKITARTMEAIGEFDLDKILDEHQATFQAWQRAQTEFSEASSKARTAKLLVTAVEAEIQKAEALAQQRALLERRATSFDGLTKYLRSNRAVFMAELWEQLMTLTSIFVSDVTAGRIEKIGRTDAGGFYYVENGATMPYARLAGGFKAVAGAGLRIALASLLPAGVSLVVLDEPSSELADDMAAALAGALRGTSRQIVLVTHRQGEEFVSDSVIELTL